MISSNDLRPGVTIEIDGRVWQVVEFQHVDAQKEENNSANGVTEEGTLDL